MYRTFYLYALPEVISGIAGESSRRRTTRKSNSPGLYKCLLILNPAAATANSLAKIEETRAPLPVLRSRTQDIAEGPILFMDGRLQDEPGIFKNKKKPLSPDERRQNCRRGNRKSGFTCSEIFIIFVSFFFLFFFFKPRVYARVYHVYSVRACVLVYYIP